MTLNLASHLMLEVLEELSNELESECSGVHWTDSSQWRKYSKTMGSTAFAYARPYKNSIVIFPRLDADYIGRIQSLDSGLYDREGGWGEEYPFWFRIRTIRDISTAISILSDAYYLS